MDPDTYVKMRALEDDHWWFVARRRIIESLLHSLSLQAGCQILEVGCGTGGNLEMLGQFGKVVGVEMDATAAKMAAERGVAPVLEGGLPASLPHFSDAFDLICLFDVIEHVEDDAASLQVLRGLLKIGGRIVMTAPAFPFLWSQHDEENRHFRRYCRPDIESLVRHGGMDLDFASYFNFWLFPPVALVRLIRKAIPYRESWGDMRKPRESTNRLLQAIFSSERHLVGRVRLPYGMSLIAVISSLQYQEHLGSFAEQTPRQIQAGE